MNLWCNEGYVIALRLTAMEAEEAGDALKALEFWTDSAVVGAAPPLDTMSDEDFKDFCEGYGRPSEVLAFVRDLRRKHQGINKQENV